MILRRTITLCLAVLLLTACSTRKNTVVSRGYHNLTARYNGYYYSCVNIDEGIYKIEKGHKDDFERVLPIYIYPTPDQAKATTPDFDKAIKKSSLCIQKHAIKDSKGSEIPTAGKWIDNNWINIGIAHFYKREYYSALEALEYVARTYPKSPDKYMALIWLAKVNNEIASVSTTESILTLLKNEKNLPWRAKNELPALAADFYFRRGQNTEAITNLIAATKNKKIIRGLPKSSRARYSFIIGQLLEESKENKRAIRYYQATLKLKPSYDLVFYSKIKIARLLDVKRSNPEKTKKDLLKMSKEFKNSEYFDVIYYTLGEIEEKEKNINRAMFYYKRSVQNSVSNRSQKAQAYLKLGEINFELTNYEPAEAYYDSAVVALPKDHPDYENIVARKKTLSTLVGYIKTINREDSLQKVARLSEIDRQLFIDRLIANKEKEEQRRQKAYEQAQNNAANQPSGGNIPGGSAPGLGNTGGSNSYYFYNPSTVAFGISDFTKKWGGRRLEDNWRRSGKTVTIDNEKEEPTNVDTSSAKETSSAKSPAKAREMYLKDLPLNDSLMTKSNNKIIKSYYLLGTVYKEDLHNNTKAIASFEKLNTRYPENKYLVKSYYILYRIYLDEKNQPKADFYKNKILNEFPDSEFALLLINPDYAREVNVEKTELEKAYNDAYNAYTGEQYAKALDLSNEALNKYGKNAYVPKFLFIKAMCSGKTQGIDALESQLKLLIVKYPNSEVTPLANDVLLAIKKQKQPELFDSGLSGQTARDTFMVNYDMEHYFVAVAPDDPKIIEAFKTKVAAFDNTYYLDKQLKISNSLFGTGKQIIIIKSFKDAQESVNYLLNLSSDNSVFKGEVKREMFELLPISTENIAFLYKKKNVSSYILFYNDNYKRLELNNQIQK